MPKDSETQLAEVLAAFGGFSFVKVRKVDPVEILSRNWHACVFVITVVAVYTGLLVTWPRAILHRPGANQGFVLVQRDQNLCVTRDNMTRSLTLTPCSEKPRLWMLDGNSSCLQSFGLPVCIHFLFSKQNKSLRLYDRNFKTQDGLCLSFNRGGEARLIQCNWGLPLSQFIEIIPCDGSDGSLCHGRGSHQGGCVCNCREPWDGFMCNAVKPHRRGNMSCQVLQDLGPARMLTMRHLWVSSRYLVGVIIGCFSNSYTMIRPALKLIPWVMFAAVVLSACLICGNASGWSCDLYRWLAIPLLLLLGTPCIVLGLAVVAFLLVSGVRMLWIVVMFPYYATFHRGRWPYADRIILACIGETPISTYLLLIQSFFWGLMIQDMIRYIQGGTYGKVSQLQIGEVMISDSGTIGLNVAPHRKPLDVNVDQTVFLEQPDVALARLNHESPIRPLEHEQLVDTKCLRRLSKLGVMEYLVKVKKQKIKVGDIEIEVPNIGGDQYEPEPDENYDQFLPADLPEGNLIAKVERFKRAGSRELDAVSLYEIVGQEKNVIEVNSRHELKSYLGPIGTDEERKELKNWFRIMDREDHEWLVTYWVSPHEPIWFERKDVLLEGSRMSQPSFPLMLTETVLITKRLVDGAHVKLKGDQRGQLRSAGLEVKAHSEVILNDQVGEAWTGKEYQVGIVEIVEKGYYRVRDANHIQGFLASWEGLHYPGPTDLLAPARLFFMSHAPWLQSTQLVLQEAKNLYSITGLVAGARRTSALAFVVALVISIVQLVEVIFLWSARRDKARFVFYERVFLVCQDAPQFIFVVWLTMQAGKGSHNALSQFELYGVVSSLLCVLQESVRTVFS